MSNKLKRKTSPKRDPQATAYKRDWQLAENCYAEVFTSLQLICFSALYSAVDDGGFDFSKQKLKNFNKFLTQHNQENIDGILSSKETDQWLWDKFDISCKAYAKFFPFSAKMKMAGRKIKPSEVKVILASVDVAIEAYLVLAIYTLHKHYRFNEDDIRRWWIKCIEVGELYSRGMTDDFIVQFMKDECDLEIVR